MIIKESVVNSKFLIFLPSLGGGGAERAMVSLANSMAHRGITVDLILMSAEGPYLSEVDEAIKIVDLKTKRAIKSIFALARYLREQAEPFVLLSAMNYVNVVALVAKIISLRNFRIVVSERTNISGYMGSSIGLRDKLVYISMRALYRFADIVVAVSEGVAEDLKGRIATKRNAVKVIYNPVITKSLIDALDDNCVSANVDSYKPYILAAGRLHESKGFVDLINAFRQAKNNGDVKLVIIGEGELRGVLESLIVKYKLEEKVFLPGFQSDPYIWMKSSKAFVLPSKFEGLPNVLIQAMACGVPVISTDCKSGPHEILKGGALGRLVPVGDIDLLTEAIEMAFEDKIRPAPFSELDRFFEENITNQYIEVMSG